MCLGLGACFQTVCASFWFPMIAAHECYVAYVNPLLVSHHLCFKPPEDGLPVYHASPGAWRPKSMQIPVNYRLARKQRPCLSSTRLFFRQVVVIYRCLDKGGG